MTANLQRAQGHQRPERAASIAYDADAIIIGAELAGFVAAAELANRGKEGMILEQEPETNLGG